MINIAYRTYALIDNILIHRDAARHVSTGNGMNKKRRAIADTPSYIRNKLKTYFTITFVRFTSEPLSRTTT